MNILTKEQIDNFVNKMNKTFSNNDTKVNVRTFNNDNVNFIIIEIGKRDIQFDDKLNFVGSGFDCT
jgi:hypothetical protein